MQLAPVVTIDGPSGAGKGTASLHIAKRFGWHLLDSGAIYRVLGLAAKHHQIDADDEQGLVPLASALDVSFVENNGDRHVILEGEDVTHEIRTETVGSIASQVASLPRVREALLRRQRAFKEDPGLVADGRDMGTVVFPTADAKIFLTASAEIRAQRRFEQLKEAGHDVNIARLLTEIKQRDERDSTRSIAPLKPAEDAFILDSSAMSIEQVVENIANFVNDRIHS